MQTIAIVCSSDITQNKDLEIELLAQKNDWRYADVHSRENLLAW